jgi:hypothetical protein
VKTFREFILEDNASLKTIYHGDNFKTTKLEPKLMNNGNNEEGIGIYFGDLKTAESYGKDIISIDINPKKFIPSRGDMGKYISPTIMLKIIKELNKVSSEGIWYMLTDYGMDIQKPEDVKDVHLKQLSNMMKDSQVRNFQIEFTQRTNVEDFVRIWNECTNIDGTFEASRGFYAVINPNYKITKIQ